MVVLLEGSRTGFGGDRLSPLAAIPTQCRKLSRQPTRAFAMTVSMYKISVPSGATRDFTGQSLLRANSLPNVYFHCTTPYAILRHCGVEVGKRDFMGTPVNL